MTSSFFEEMKGRKQALLLFLPLTLFYAASYFQRTAIPGTTFNHFQTTFGFNAAEIAGLATAFVFIYAFCQLVVGMLADKFGGIRIVTVAGAIFCAGVMGFPFCGGNLTLMYICRFLTGLGASSIYLSQVKEIDRLFGRKNYSIILGIVYFVGYSGGFFGTLPFQALCGKFYWIDLLIIIGIVSTVLYILFLFARRLVPDAPIRDVPLSLRPLWKIMKNPLSWMVVFSSTVIFTSNSVIQMVFGKKFLQDVAGMSEIGASAVISAQILVCMFALLTGGIQTRLTGNRRKPLMIFSAILAMLNTVLMFCAIIFHLPAAVYAISLLLYAIAAGLSISYPMACQEVNSRDCLTLAAGFNNTCNYLGLAIVSPLAGLLLNQFAEHSSGVGKAVIYPTEAYCWLFALMLIPMILGVIVACLIPETKGHFLRLHIEKSS